MKIKFQIIFFTTFFCIFFSIISAKAADWVNDYIDGLVTTQSTSGQFESQTRNYFNGAQFHVRKPFQNKQSLVSITPPSLKMGCGGIDFNLGSFSLLNFDYLVQSLQNIIASAPAFAFENALTYIAPEMTSILNSMKHFANEFSQMQMDECQMSKDLVATVLPPHGESRKSFSSYLTESSYLQGVSESFTQAKDSLKNNGTSGANQAAKGSGGCPNTVVSFNGLSIDNGGGMLKYFSDSARLNFIPSGTNGANMVKILRGLLGDVYFDDDPNGAIRSHYLDKCPGAQSNSEILDAFLAGTINGIDSPAGGVFPSCAAITDGNGLKTYISSQIMTIYGKMKTKTALTDDETKLLEALPSDVYIFLKQLFMANASNAALASYSDFTAKGYAYGMISAVVSEVYQFSDKFKKEIKDCENKLDESVENKACSLCQPGVTDVDVDKWVERSKETLAKIQREWDEEANKIAQREYIRNVIESYSVRIKKDRLGVGQR